MTPSAEEPLAPAVSAANHVEEQRQRLSTRAAGACLRIGKIKFVSPNGLSEDQQPQGRAGHIQMARELGLNPKKFGGLANTSQKHWKAPLPEFIEELYFQRFKRSRPENVRSIEKMVSDANRKKAERRARKETAAQSQPSDKEESPPHRGDRISRRAS